jgi:hypothetical protein
MLRRFFHLAHVFATGHTRERRVSFKKREKARGSPIRDQESGIRDQYRLSDEAQALAFPSPAWRGRVARQGRERASSLRRSRKFFCSMSFVPPASCKGDACVAPTRFPPLPGHPLPRSLGGEGKASGGASLHRLPPFSIASADARPLRHIPAHPGPSRARTGPTGFRREGQRHTPSLLPLLGGEGGRRPDEGLSGV